MLNAADVAQKRGNQEVPGNGIGANGKFSRAQARARQLTS